MSAGTVRYKLLELLGYVAMGAVPALVILSMVIISFLWKKKS